LKALHNAFHALTIDNEKRGLGPFLSELYILVPPEHKKELSLSLNEFMI
jgi:hypothetical protein